MPVVNVVGVGNVNFPDSMSKEEIKSAIERDILPKHAANMGSPHVPSSNPGLQHPSLLNRIGNNSLQFAEGAGAELANTPANIYNMLTPKSLNVGLLPAPDSTAGKMGEFAGDIGSFAAGGEAAGGARLAAEAIPYIGKLAKALSGIGGRALGAGAYGASQNPNERLKGGAESGVLSAALETAFGAPGYALSKLRGTTAPEELLANLEAAKGTNTDLGNVIQSPTLQKSYENFLSHIPFNTSVTQMKKSALAVKNKGESILSKLLGNNDPNDLKIQLQEALKNSSMDADKLNRLNAKGLNEFADSMGLAVGRENFSQEANDILSDINKSPELKDEMSEQILTDLKRYSNPSRSNNLKLSNIFKGKIGDKASEHYTNDRNYEYGIYKRLKDALQEDIDTSIASSRSSELKNNYRDYMDFYRKEIVPFKSPEIQKFIKQGGDSDLILSTFIKSGKNDRAILANKLMSKLSKDKKNLVPYAYLSKAVEDGELNPLKVQTLYKNLGQEQKKVLFNPEDKKSLDSFSKSVSMNKEPLTMMLNPKTGQRNLTPISAALHGMTAIGGGLDSGVFGALLGAAAPTAATIPLVQGLTNEKLREKLVTAMINQAKGQQKSTTKKQITRNILIPLLNHAGGQ